MSDLGDILAQKKLPHEPIDFSAIRDYVVREFNITPGLQLRGETIVITMPNAAAAGALRFQLPALKSELAVTAELIIAHA